MALIDSVKRHEGFRSHLYKDSVGVNSIGYGTNLDVGIDDAEATFLLQHRLDRVADEVEKALPWVIDLNQARFDVFVEMAYNLGLNGFLGFHRMIAMAEARNFEGAAAAMLESKWSAQVGQRAKQLSEILRTGIDA